MELINYLDTGNEWFGKGLDVVRDLVGKLGALFSIDQQFAVVIISLALSLYLGYFVISKFTTHPFNASNIGYIAIISFLIFEILVYL